MSATLSDQEFSAADLSEIERLTQEIGRSIFDHLSRRRPTLFERRWWEERVMTWAMRDDAVKTQMFRFVDVLPMLRTNEAVTQHLKEYFRDVSDALPTMAQFSIGVARPRALSGRLLAYAARKTALAQARRFIAGSDVAEVLAAARRQREHGRAFTLDILGEAVTSEAEAERYFRAYVDLIRGVAPAVNAWPANARIDRDVSGDVPRVNVSVKLSALDSQFDPLDFEGSARRVKARLRELLRLAARERTFVHVDMESYRAKDLTLAIFKQVLSEEEFRATRSVGIVIQCYLKDSRRDLESLRDWAEERGTPVWVRLVKGAYWDYETITAAALGWPSPVYEEKSATDANFEACARFVIRNHQWLRPALGSHNVRSLAHGLAVAKYLKLPQDAVELQMLYGMADGEQEALVELGHRLRIYMPYGELIPGMAYLVRRLLENTSNESFLRATFSEETPVDRLLAPPAIHSTDSAPAAEPEHPLAVSRPSSPERPHLLEQLRTFTPMLHNEPPTDFAIESNRRSMQQALDEVRGQLGQFYPLWIDGRPVETAERLPSVNPAKKSEVIGYTAAGGKADANAAVAAAREALRTWGDLGADLRAHYLRSIAAAMRRRRFKLAAWEVLECAKEWREADADVCEAIDFCEYYAQGAIELETPNGADLPGEENRFEYLPRGVTAVIAPWNFPLAIITGMTAAALATGNTVVMKPAEPSAIIAAKMMQICQEVGLPPGVLNYLPGKGSIVGAAMVEHPDVAMIAFTGSREVGLAINVKAAQVSASGATTTVKRVIAEMGGKNAVIVDDDADLDEAVVGVVKSAFGYQGQKCSACSRVIVLAGVYDAFVERLVEATRSLKVGPPEDPATFVGPVIDAAAQERIREYIKVGRETGRAILETDVSALAEEGFYVGPTIFVDVAPNARVAQEEIFGPVLVVLKARDMDEAIRIFNDVPYALTGGIFSRSPARLERARRELQAGNLYLNRGITGALVGRQPFGGYKMSGIGTKAGGPDYLLQFVIPRTVTENTMRRGFAPTGE